MRRSAPRPLAPAVEQVSAGLAPPNLLASVQRLWEEAAGLAVAREAEPSSERDGTVTVTCRSAVWAHELELLSGELLARLNEALTGPGGPPAVRSLRFVAARRGAGGRRPRGRS